MNRYDILIKYVCLHDFHMNGKTWPKITAQIYKTHLDIMTSGTFREAFGGKSGIEKYRKVFEQISTDIETNHSQFGTIPLSNSHTPIDGAHRVASALYHKKTLKYKIETNITEPDYNFDYFVKNNFYYNGYVINTLLSNSPSIRLAIIWPSSLLQDEILNTLPDKVLISKIYPDNNSAHNVVVNAYLNEPWLGEYGTNYKGAWEKVAACFTEKREAYLVLFDLKDKNVNELKKNIRGLVDVGKHSIHITDTPSETMEKANIFFCSNFEKWAKLARLNNGRKFIRKMESFKKVLESEGLDVDDYVITKGTCMELFSVRDSVDFDLISSIKPDNKINSFFEVEQVKAHNFFTNYFSFNGLKFWGFEQLLSDRYSKSDQKSKFDQKLLTVGGGRGPLHTRLKYFLNRRIQIFKRHILNLLVDLKLYNTIRFLYRLFKPKI